MEKNLKILFLVGITLFLFGCEIGSGTSKKEEKLKELDINGSVVRELYSMSEVPFCPDVVESQYYKKSYTLVLENSFLTGTLFSNEISTNPTYQYASSSDSNQTTFTWNLEDVESAWHKLFGFSSNINQSGVLGTLTKENYSQTFLTLGDACGPIRKGYVSHIVRATENEEEISIYESVLFITNKSECTIEQCDGEYEYYFDIDRTKETTEANRTANYRRIFKKDTDGHYYFYAIERLL